MANKKTDKEPEKGCRVAIWVPISMKKQLEKHIPYGYLTPVIRALLEDLILALQKDDSGQRELLAMFLKRSVALDDMLKAESNPAFRRLITLAKQAADVLEQKMEETNLAAKLRETIEELV